MATPKDPNELSLVTLAITCGVIGCCEWDERAARRFRGAPPMSGLTPNGVKSDLIAHVCKGGAVVQVPETRPEYNDRPFYYKVILPVSGLRHGLFIEMVLVDDDPEVPTVHIVNAHEQNT